MASAEPPDNPSIGEHKPIVPGTAGIVPPLGPLEPLEPLEPLDTPPLVPPIGLVSSSTGPTIPLIPPVSSSTGSTGPTTPLIPPVSRLTGSTSSSSGSSGSSGSTSLPVHTHALNTELECIYNANTILKIGNEYTVIHRKTESWNPQPETNSKWQKLRWGSIWKELKIKYGLKLENEKIPGEYNDSEVKTLGLLQKLFGVKGWNNTAPIDDPKLTLDCKIDPEIKKRILGLFKQRIKTINDQTALAKSIGLENTIEIKVLKYQIKMLKGYMGRINTGFNTGENCFTTACLPDATPPSGTDLGKGPCNCDEIMNMLAKIKIFMEIGGKDIEQLKKDVAELKADNANIKQIICQIVRLIYITLNSVYYEQYEPFLNESEKLDIFHDLLPGRENTIEYDRGLFDILGRFLVVLFQKKFSLELPYTLTFADPKLTDKLITLFATNAGMVARNSARYAEFVRQYPALNLRIVQTNPTTYTVKESTEADEAYIPLSFLVIGFIQLFIKDISVLHSKLQEWCGFKASGDLEGARKGTGKVGIVPPIGIADEDMSHAIVPPMGMEEDMSQSLVPPVGVFEDMSQSLVPPLGMEEDMSQSLVPPMGMEEDMSQSLVPPMGMEEDMSQSLVPPVGVFEDMSQSLVPPMGIAEDMTQSLVPPMGIAEDMSHAVVPPVGMEEDMSHAVVPPVPPAISGGKRTEFHNPALTIRAIICEITRHWDKKLAPTDNKLNEFYLTGKADEIKGFVEGLYTIFNLERFSGGDGSKSLLNRMKTDPTKKYETTGLNANDISEITSDSKNLLHEIFRKWITNIDKGKSNTGSKKDSLKKQLKCFIVGLFKTYVTGYDFKIDPHRFPGYIDGSTELEKYRVITDVVYDEFKELVDDDDGSGVNLFSKLGLDIPNGSGQELKNYVLQDYDPSLTEPNILADDCKRTLSMIDNGEKKNPSEQTKKELNASIAERTERDRAIRVRKAEMAAAEQQEREAKEAEEQERQLQARKAAAAASKRAAAAAIQEREARQAERDAEKARGKAKKRGGTRKLSRKVQNKSKKIRK